MFKFNMDYLKNQYSILLSLFLVYFPIFPDTNTNLVKVFRDGYSLNLYNLIMKKMLENNLEVTYLLFIIYFIILNLWFSITYDVLNKNKSFFLENRISIFIILFFMFSHRDLGDLNRFLLANFIFIYTNLNIKLKILKISLYILAFYIHSGIIILILIAFLSDVLKRIDILKLLQKNKINIVIITFILLFMNKGLIFIVNILKIFNEDLGNKLYFYLNDPNCGYLFLLNGSLGLIIYRIINIFGVGLLGYTVLSNKNFKKEKSVKNFYTFFFLLLILLVNYRTFSERYSLIFIIYSIIYLFKFSDKKNTKIKVVAMYIFIKFMLFTYPYLGVWSERYDYLVDKNIKYQILEKLTYLSGIELLNFKKNGYSNEILEENLREKLW